MGRVSVFGGGRRRRSGGRSRGARRPLRPRGIGSEERRRGRPTRGLGAGLQIRYRVNETDAWGHLWLYRALRVSLSHPVGSGALPCAKDGGMVLHRPHLTLVAVGHTPHQHPQPFHKKKHQQPHRIMDGRRPFTKSVLLIHLTHKTIDIIRVSILQLKTATATYPSHAHKTMGEIRVSILDLKTVPATHPRTQNYGRNPCFCPVFENRSFGLPGFSKMDTISQ